MSLLQKILQNVFCFMTFLFYKCADFMIYPALWSVYGVDND